MDSRVDKETVMDEVSVMANELRRMTVKINTLAGNDIGRFNSETLKELSRGLEEIEKRMRSFNARVTFEDDIGKEDKSGNVLK